MSEIRGTRLLPARRRTITLHTEDGQSLHGELSLPESRDPVATLVMLHPLPTAGGSMESHIVRKAAARLPALADLAVLRFNTRGTSSPTGASSGAFADGVGERADLAAAMAFVAAEGLPEAWLVGWSFGSELALKYGLEHDIAGAMLLSPPLRRTRADELARWSGAEPRLIALIPELDDLLPPEPARARFAAVPNAELVIVAEGRHLWVGETQTRRVLTEIVAAANPEALPLATEWPNTR